MRALEKEKKIIYITKNTLEVKNTTRLKNCLKKS